MSAFSARNALDTTLPNTQALSKRIRMRKSITREPGSLTRTKLSLASLVYELAQASP